METLALPSLFYCLIAFSTFLQFCIAADTISSGQSISGNQTLVSSGQVFELGFFSSGNNKSRYLGIWYKKTPGILVWIANQNNPLTDASGVFTISNNGTLILLNQRNHTIWYSNLSRVAQTPVAQLLDSGNLVLEDSVTSSSKSYLWKSFDYPLNTWLPGMTIGKDMNNGVDRFLTSCRDSDIASPSFDFTTIATATNKFSQANVIGAGGFGPVYKGNLCNGQDIAVKRLSKDSRQGLKEFKNEVVLIAKLQHRNLISLLGYCIQGDERMLIYEYMPNKSLNYFIFEQNESAMLAWPKRYEIVVGIVRGLLYLHQDSRLQVIHRDLKASNILLDINLNPKISDFGLARTFGGDESEVKTDRVVGTYGYISPEYAVDGTFSVKSDVFSLGVLMLEIVSGKKNRKFFHPDHHHNLLGHAWLLWKEGRALELLFTCLEDSDSISQVLRYIQVGLLCVQKFPEDRPTMSCVLSMLTNAEVILPEPKQPGFFIERSSSNAGTTSRNEESSIENVVTITMPEAR